MVKKKIKDMSIEERLEALESQNEYIIEMLTNIQDLLTRPSDDSVEDELADDEEEDATIIQGNNPEVEQDDTSDEVGEEGDD